MLARDRSYKLFPKFSATLEWQVISTFGHS
jgi:hypothetical protein